MSRSLFIFPRASRRLLGPAPPFFFFSVTPSCSSPQLRVPSLTALTLFYPTRVIPRLRTQRAIMLLSTFSPVAPPQPSGRLLLRGQPLVAAAASSSSPPSSTCADHPSLRPLNPPGSTSGRFSAADRQWRQRQSSMLIPAVAPSPSRSSSQLSTVPIPCRLCRVHLALLSPRASSLAPISMFMPASFILYSAFDLF